MATASTSSQPIWLHRDFRRGGRDTAGIAIGVSAWGRVGAVAMLALGRGQPWLLALTV